MPTALVLDGAQRSALAITRSLGAHGIKVLVAEAAPDYLCAHSRLASRALICPSAADDTAAFLDWLHDAITEHCVDMVIPATDITTNTLVLYRDVLGNQSACALAQPAVYDQLTDKYTLVRLAAELGIPAPESTLITPGAALPPIDGGGGPVVLKPTRSKFFEANHWLATAVKIAQSPADIARLTAATPSFMSHPWMLQQYIEGEGQGIFALYDHGRAVCFFAHRRLREKPPWGGVSVLCESVEPDGQMVELSRRLLDHVGWHGVAMVEFKVAADGTPYLMEVNTRFWGSLQLAIDSGIDFPWLLWQIATGQRPDPPAAFRTGRRLRWFLGDVDSLYIALTDGRYSTADKLRRLRDFFTPGFGQTRHELFRWRDPGPALFEVRQYLRNHAGIG